VLIFDLWLTGAIVKIESPFTVLLFKHHQEEARDYHVMWDADTFLMWK